jgi:hypothetical protein
MKSEFVEYTHILKFIRGKESIVISFTKKSGSVHFDGLIVREGYQDFTFPWRGEINRLKVLLLIDKYITMAVQSD